MPNLPNGAKSIWICWDFLILYENSHGKSLISDAFSKGTKNHRPQQQQLLRLSSLATLAEQVKVPWKSEPGAISKGVWKELNVEVIHVAIRHPEKNGNWEPLPDTLWICEIELPSGDWHAQISEFQPLHLHVSFCIFFQIKTAVSAWSVRKTNLPMKLQNFWATPGGLALDPTIAACPCSECNPIKQTEPGKCIWYIWHVS